MTSIKKELVVEASQETAFQVFSQKMDLWWPRSHHVGPTPMKKMVLEPKEKGRWYSTHQGGETCEVGFVQRFQPNSLLVLIWQLNGAYAFDPNLHTEVEIKFEALGPQQTRVSFEHRDIEKLGKAIDGMEQGWGMILDLFSDVAKNGKLQGEKSILYQRLSIPNPGDTATDKIK
jgi:uncharacterized protein YndB with AHSA1/START domain